MLQSRDHCLQGRIEVCSIGRSNAPGRDKGELNQGKGDGLPESNED